MTRETKIGLLVGLAFIIVIGILLSDHLTNSTEPPAATLAGAGPNIRQQVTVPGASGATAPAIVVTPQVTPSQPLATQRDLIRPTPASAVVQVGGPAAQPAPQAAGNDTNPPIVVLPATQTPTAPAETAVPREAVASNDPNNSTETPLSRLAQQHGEALVDGSGREIVSTGPGKPVQTASAGNSKDYVVQAGDSLSRLATHFYGTNTKANRDLIVKANPSLAADPNKLIVGKSYKIPAAAAAVSTLVKQPEAPKPAVVAEVVTPAVVEPAKASATPYIYTVKEGDSLWRIASEQLGKGGTGVAAIKELNKDVLNGSDVVLVDMKLRLPGKPVAQLN